MKSDCVWPTEIDWRSAPDAVVESGTIAGFLAATEEFERRESQRDNSD